MRKASVLTLTFVIAVTVAAPSFAKVCHPKMPLTCTAAHLSQAPAPAVLAVPVKKAHQSIQPIQPKVQHAMLCGPWVKWMCTAQPGLI